MKVTARRTILGLAAIRKSRASSAGNAQNAAPSANTLGVTLNAPAACAKATMTRAQFKTWALMEARAGGIAVSIFAGSTAKKFLAMYLDGKVDAQAVVEAGKLLESSAELAKLAADVQRELQFRVMTFYCRLPSDAEIAADTQKYLRDTFAKDGITFYGDLNAVVGGITGISTESPAKTVRPKSTPSTLAYTVSVEIFDSYDFENKKGTKPDDDPTLVAYDKQRRKWATMLDEGKYQEVYDQYHDALFHLPYYPPKDDGTMGAWERFKKSWSAKPNKLTFTALLHAIEHAGMTPGPLPWSVKVPISGKLSYAAITKKKEEKKEKHDTKEKNEKNKH